MSNINKMETDKKKKQTEKAREQARETLKIKGLLSFISKKSKKATYKNKLIDELINNGIYNTIYNKYISYINDTEEDDKDDERIYNYLNEKELNILSLFDFVEPDELETKKEGFIIQELSLNIANI